MSYWNGQRWVAEAPPHRQRQPRASRARDWTATTLMVVLIPALLLVMAGMAAAAKPTSSVWVNEVDAARSPGAPLGFGDPFTVGYQSKEREPWALTQCFPNGTTVFSSTYADGSIWSSVFSVYPGGPSPQAFVLGESVYALWTGGGADCVVSLVTYSRDLSRMAVHATSWFTVEP